MGYQKALVNWDTKFKTAISDLEVVPTDVSTQIYYIKYPSSNSESITVATVRPETIFGDVAIAVNPNVFHLYLMNILIPKWEVAQLKLLQHMILTILKSVKGTT